MLLSTEHLDRRVSVLLSARLADIRLLTPYQNDLSHHVVVADTLIVGRLVRL